jgi:hypothetical protein
MNSIQELRTDTNQQLQRFLSTTYSPLEQRWKCYLGIAPSQLHLSQDHQFRLGLTRMFHQFQLENRVLFHMTITYKTYQNTPHSPKNTNDFFINFYLKCFLPNLLGTRNFHTPNKRMLQPICYSFLDEHEPKVKKLGDEIEFADRLHHHAILAVHPNTVDRMMRMTGQNAVPIRSKYASKVMTAHIVECEAMRTLYATKQLKKYAEFLCFPDRLGLTSAASI